MNAEAVIHLHFSSSRQLQVVFEALKPEIRTTLSRRCQARIYEEKKSLTLMFEARDTSALRAAVNSYLRWILLAKTIVESINLLDSKG